MQLSYDHASAATSQPAWTCPVDGAPLAQAPNDLRCRDGHAYRIVDGIPRFVGESTYADHFGLQWKAFARTQLDSHTGLPISRDRLRRVLGETLWNSLKGKNVLECGCGAGRFTEILLEMGANVTSVDLSTAVDANAANFPINARHRVAQADIMHLPFQPGSFDVVLCLGVIQHTPSPEKTIEALFEQVAPGGALAIDHYTYDFRNYTSAMLLYRAWMKRLAPDRALAVTQRMVDRLLPLHKRFAHVRPVRAVLCRLSPVRSVYTEFPELRDDLQKEWAVLETHDALTDWYKHFRSRSQIQRTLQGLGATQIWCTYGGNGVEARATRP